jgi:GTP-binding protein HflX
MMLMKDKVSMSKIIQNISKDKSRKKALLVGVQMPGVSDMDHKRSMEELARLVDTLGMTHVHSLNQKVKSQNASSVVGPGKLLEVAKWAGGSGVIEIETHRKVSKAQLKRDDEASLESGDLGEDDDHYEDELEDVEDASEESEPLGQDGVRPERVDFVVFDSELTPTQLRNLQQSLDAEVLDRTGVIVEIFFRHAQTPAAKAQVEIARLTYLSPRLRATGGGDRQGGGIGAKGAGETKHELDKRRIRDRIAELKANLDNIHEEHALRRSRRKDSQKIALVGYTNAGKSSLMRALTGSEVLVADKLFATLDTTVRALYPETKPKILATDTVGFIQKLPHELVASFKTTLDEALDASLLLYVVDASDFAFRDQLKTTIEVLSEIEAVDIPHILILNKSDRLSAAQMAELKAEFPEGIFVCTRDAKSVALLREIVIQHFEQEMTEAEFLVPYAKGAAVAELHKTMRILSETHSDEGTLIRVRGFKADIDRTRKQFAL